MAIVSKNYDITADICVALEHSGADITKLAGKVVLVTGGTGFFGRWFLALLVEVRRRLGGDLEIISVSRNPKIFLDGNPDLALEGVEYLSGDIVSFKIPNHERVTHLVHLATTTAQETFTGFESTEKLHMLYAGSRNLLAQCPEELESLLFTSSGVAYGITENADLVEEGQAGFLDTLDAGVGLALGKLAAEYLIAAHSKKRGYKFSIARCFSFAGQFLPLDLHYAFGNFVESASNNRAIQLRSDGSDLRSYLYVGDAMAWLLRLLIEPRNGIYNVGSETPISIRQLAETITQELGSSGPIETLHQAKEDGNFKRRCYVPSTERIRQHYSGLQEWTSLKEIIRKM